MWILNERRLMHFWFGGACTIPEGPNVSAAQADEVRVAPNSRPMLSALSSRTTNCRLLTPAVKPAAGPMADMNGHPPTGPGGPLKFSSVDGSEAGICPMGTPFRKAPAVSSAYIANAMCAPGTWSEQSVNVVL